MSRYPATLRQGDKGTGVKWLQSLLIANAANISVDGSFGPKTNEAVRAWQAKKKLTQDGIVGPASWESLVPKAVYYRQNDPAWGGKPFTIQSGSGQTIANSGCGPTSMSMVIATWQNAKITPVEECAEAVKRGFRTLNSGTSHSYFADAAKRYGLKCLNTASIATVQSALKRGALVIGNMGPVYYTKGGHYILLWAINPYDDTIYTLDPASAARPSCTSALMAREAKQYFIIER